MSASTLAAYGSAMTQWRDFCTEEEHCQAMGPVSPALAAGFLAWLADSDSVAASTIAGYKSGMRHHWLTANDHGDPDACPFTSHLANTAMTGIRRALAKRDQENRAARSVTASVGPRQLVKVHHFFHPPGVLISDEQAMYWAAATLGAYGLLRPNEFLGSYLHADRKLRPEQIVFFVRAGSQEKAVVGQFNGPPHRFSVRLGPTKADQEGANAPIVIGERLAVEALWLWMRRRSSFAPEDRLGPVFKLPGQRPLTIRQLIDRLELAFHTVDPSAEKISLTGRCFRRGGAADLVQSGASLEQIQHAGRWSSSAMVYTYTDPAVVREREAAAASGSMAPLRPSVSRRDTYTLAPFAAASPSPPPPPSSA